MENSNLEKYASLLVRVGGNVQKGQLVVISCDIRDADFGRLVMNCAYDAGASNVDFIWSDEISERAWYLRADNCVFDSFPQWRVDKYKYLNSKGAVYLVIESSDPDWLVGVDSDRIRRYRRVADEAMESYVATLMRNELRWSICALPSPSWAKKIFPSLQEVEAVDNLMKLILRAARADGADPIASWKAHNQTFVERIKYLNEQQFSALRITTGLGTDLTVGLVKNHRWVGGSSKCKDGIHFFPNLPTEEVYTMPDCNRAHGNVVASKPLSYEGILIEDFELEFENGKISGYRAQKNGEILSNIIQTDQGASRLGEIAIVSNSSPINQMGVLFYNTLFDENAAAHLALGKAYPDTIEGGTSMTQEELVSVGANDSLIHVDFMFGTPDMRIVGIKEGSEVVFFDKGEFV